MKAFQPATVFPAILVLAACGGTSIQSVFSPTQRAAVDDFLREHPKAELVQTSDCTSPDLDKFVSENPNYRPYYAEGDFTGDGSFDFVIATKSAGAYDLWLFPGAGADYKAPQNFATLTWLHEGGFIVRGRNLYVGTLYGDTGNFYSWEASINRFAIISNDQP